MLELALLGCGGGMPMPFRHLSSMLLNIKGRKILIDCGEGTQVSMRMLGWGFKSLDIICITHVHGDHIVGLPGLLSTIGNSGRTESLTIIGPKGIKEVLNGLRVICPYLPYEINIIENPRYFLFEINKDKIEITCLEVDHSSPCLSYSFYVKRNRKFDLKKALEKDIPKELWNLLQKESSIVFEGINYTSDMILGEERKGIKLSIVTDSRPLQEISDFIKDSDLFICEGTYGDEMDIEKAIKNKHMTFSEAATLAKNGEVKELLLTHFSPAMLDPEEFIKNATNIFPNTKIGKDRLTLTLKFTE